MNKPLKAARKTALDDLLKPPPVQDLTMQLVQDLAPAHHLEPEPAPDDVFSDPAFTNLDKSKGKKLVDFNFKVKPKFRSDVKITAARWNMSSKALIDAAFNLFLEYYGDTPQKAQQKHQTRLQQKRRLQELDTGTKALE